MFVRHLSIGARLALTLVLLALSGAVPASAAQHQGAAAAPASAAIVIGANSCIGDDACTGAIGPIGDNSCNGSGVCYEAQGSIGDNSCNYDASCYQAQGAIGDGSCGSDTSACFQAQGAIGDNSCNGNQACEGTAGPIGDNSCNGGQACNGALGAIGGGSCSGSSACYHATGSIGQHSCNGDGSCDQLSLSVGDCANNAVPPAECVQPDGRIRLGRGAFKGNDIYNTSGLNQSKVGAKPRGYTIKFGISIQNDSTTTADSFKLSVTGAASAMYTVTYWRGTTNITAAVVAGTYTTPTLAPGAKYLVTVKVKVNSSATKGSSTTRLVTITSVGNPTKEDAVMLTGKRG